MYPFKPQFVILGFHFIWVSVFNKVYFSEPVMVCEISFAVVMGSKFGKLRLEPNLHQTTSWETITCWQIRSFSFLLSYYYLSQNFKLFWMVYAGVHFFTFTSICMHSEFLTLNNNLHCYKTLLIPCLMFFIVACLIGYFCFHCQSSIMLVCRYNDFSFCL